MGIMLCLLGLCFALLIISRYVYLEYVKPIDPKDCTPEKFEAALRSRVSDRKILRMVKHVPYSDITTLEEVRAVVMEHRPHLFAAIQCLDSSKPIV